MTRLANVNDITSLLELGQKALDVSFAAPAVDLIQARRYLAQAINDKTHLVLVAEHERKIVGFIIGVIVPYWFSKDRFATDLAFYCLPQNGNYAPYLARRFIKWAKKQPNVLDVTMGITTGVSQAERIGKMYKKLGMTCVGSSYTQLLTGDNHE